MHKIGLWVLAFTLLSCKEAAREQPNAVEYTSENNTSIVNPYPQALRQVLDSHGGLDSWRQQKYLTYEIPKKNMVERHHIDLYSRKDRIETEVYQMGFDGNEVWIRDPKGQYTGDPVFYHNLMFYFYAMPFVLADPGIVYFEIESLKFDGKTYPGLGIRYDDGIGTSPEDEYFLYYHPDSFEMAWLGYTVTYRTGQPSEDIHWIRYGEWTSLSGLRLPESMTWYTAEDGLPISARNTVKFQNIALSKTQAKQSLFSIPEEAEIRKPVRTGE